MTMVISKHVWKFFYSPSVERWYLCPLYWDLGGFLFQPTKYSRRCYISSKTRSENTMWFLSDSFRMFVLGKSLFYVRIFIVLIPHHARVECNHSWQSSWGQTPIQDTKPMSEAVLDHPEQSIYQLSTTDILRIRKIAQPSPSWILDPQNLCNMIKWLLF